MAKRSTYSDDEKAQALAVLESTGGNVSAASRLTGVPRPTLIDWRENRGVSKVTVELRQEKKQELAAKLEEIAHKLVDAMSNKIDSATLVQTATSLGIAIEKMQLLKGKPTERVETVQTWLEDLPTDEYESVIAEAERIIRASGGADS